MVLRSRRYRFYGVKEAVKLMGRAVHRFGMIHAQDRVMVAYSGGVDSGLMLRLLRERLKWIPIEYTLVAVHVDHGFPGSPKEEIRAHMAGEGVEFHLIETDIGPRAFSDENTENPCFLCSRLRRKLLFEKARELGCTKVALGHSMDDLIETFFLNVLYTGQASTMLPKQELFGGRITIVRPMILLDGPRVRAAAKKLGLGEHPNPCPGARDSERTRVRDLLAGLYRDNPKVRGNIYRALTRVHPELIVPGLEGPEEPEPSG